MGFVRYNQENVPLNQLRPAKCVQFVSYNRVFVITEFVIIKFHCIIITPVREYQNVFEKELSKTRQSVSSISV
jgi:hypothetical protein